MIVNGDLVLNMPQEIKDIRDEVRLLAERANVYTEAVYQQLNTGAVAVDIATTPEHVKALLEYAICPVRLSGMH